MRPKLRCPSRILPPLRAPSHVPARGSPREAASPSTPVHADALGTANLPGARQPFQQVRPLSRHASPVFDGSSSIGITHAFPADDRRPLRAWRIAGSNFRGYPPLLALDFRAFPATPPESSDGTPSHRVLCQKQRGIRTSVENRPQSKRPFAPQANRTPQHAQRKNNAVSLGDGACRIWLLPDQRGIALVSRAAITMSV